VQRPSTLEQRPPTHSKFWAKTCLGEGGGGGGGNLSEMSKMLYLF